MGLADIDKFLAAEQPAPKGLAAVDAAVTRPETAMEYVRGARDKFKQATTNTPVTKAIDQYTPSAATALSLTTPGVGVGASALRTGLTGGAQAADSALSGRGNPMAEGAKGAAGQAVSELLPFLGPVLKFGAAATPFIGNAIQTRAINRQTQALSDLLRQPRGVPPAAPGEYMGKYVPTGIPASKILGPSGQPMRPAVDPQIVPHKDLRGWTLGDVLNQSGQAAKQTADKMDPIKILMRMLGAGGEEAIDRARE